MYLESLLTRVENLVLTWSQLVRNALEEELLSILGAEKLVSHGFYGLDGLR